MTYKQRNWLKKNLGHSPDGIENNSLTGDPQFGAFDLNENHKNDYRISRKGSAADAGVILPNDLFDPLRPDDNIIPDIGAIPSEGNQLRVGINGRRVAGVAIDDIKQHVVFELTRSYTGFSIWH